MKYLRSCLLPALAALTVAAGCNRVDEKESDFDNVVYLQNAIRTNTDRISFRATDFTAERTIQAAMALPLDRDVNVTVEIDLSLVDYYSKAYGVECSAPEEYMYELSSTNLFIPAGNVLSTEAVLSFNSLPDIDLGDTRVLPVTLKSVDADIDILNGSRTIFYVLQKGAIIITAAYTNENYFTVPGFATATGDVVKGLKQLTVEGLMRPHAFDRTLSTFMGIEGYFLIRFGDTDRNPNQIQIADDNNLGGNFPAASVAPAMPVDEWVHVAVTLDLETSRDYNIYFNGELRATGTCGGTMTEVNWNSAAFYIGFSLDSARSLDADITEYRIWNTVRTQEEIQENFYEVEPDSPGLVAYWKFDEGSGNRIEDHTGNGNYAQAAENLEWVPVSLPEEN